MLSNLSIHLPHFLRSGRNLTAISVCTAVASFSTYLLTRKTISAAERERARRDHLALNGRITDGSITETQTAPSDSELQQETNSNTPSVLIYQYQIAGVVYECAQDVTSLPDLVHQIRIDLPVQVRFDPRNPGNSIVVAESWSGLRLSPRRHSSNPNQRIADQPQEQPTEHTHA